MRDTRRYSSAKGDILEVIKADVDMPPAVFINEDPPLHTIHRALVSRAFTTGKMRQIEQQVRRFTAACLDPQRENDRFDFVAELGAGR
jgi:cytochrome P450